MPELGLQVIGLATAVKAETSHIIYMHAARRILRGLRRRENGKPVLEAGAGRPTNNA